MKNNYRRIVKPNMNIIVIISYIICNTPQTGPKPMVFRGVQILAIFTSTPPQKKNLLIYPPFPQGQNTEFRTDQKYKKYYK